MKNYSCKHCGTHSDETEVCAVCRSQLLYSCKYYNSRRVKEGMPIPWCRYKDKRICRKEGGILCKNCLNQEDVIPDGVLESNNK